MNNLLYTMMMGVLLLFLSMVSISSGLKYIRSNAQLSSVPSDIPQDAVSVNLQFNNIINVLQGVFSNLFQLEELYLGYNLLTTLPKLDGIGMYVFIIVEIML